MHIIRTRNGAPITEEERRRIHPGESPQVRAVYSAVLTRLERERELK